jgi:hypothetical protein
MTVMVVVTTVVFGLLLAVGVGVVVRLAREAHRDLELNDGLDDVLDRRLAAARMWASSVRSRTARALARASLEKTGNAG